MPRSSFDVATVATMAMAAMAAAMICFEARRQRLRQSQTSLSRCGLPEALEVSNCFKTNEVNEVNEMRN